MTLMIMILLLHVKTITDSTVPTSDNPSSSTDSEQHISTLTAANSEETVITPPNTVTKEILQENIVELSKPQIEQLSNVSRLAQQHTQTELTKSTLEARPPSTEDTALEMTEEDLPFTDEWVVMLGHRKFSHEANSITNNQNPTTFQSNRGRRGLVFMGMNTHLLT